MGVLKAIPEIKIKYNNVFHLRNFYVMMHQMLQEEGWSGLAGDPEHKDIETFYSENVYAKGMHKGGKEMWVYWRFNRAPADRANNFFLFELDIDMHMSYIQDIEVMQQGKKMKADKGEIEFYMRPRLIGDPNHEWDHHWFLKYWKHIYEHRIMHAEVLKMEKELWRLSNYIAAKVKQYFQMRNNMDVGEPLFERKFGFGN